MATSQVPVILDTDIGDDIDDTWALGFALKCPQISLKYVLTNTGDVVYRAKIVAKFLSSCGRVDIPIGIGVPTVSLLGKAQQEWVQDYSLESYPGKVYSNGLEFLLKLVSEATEPITIVAIGPLTNLAECIKKDPSFGQKVKLVTMLGSIRKGHGGSPIIVPEYNVRADISAAQKVISSIESITLVPLDTCGTFQLAGKNYSRLKNSKDPIVTLILKNYAIFGKFKTRYGSPYFSPGQELTKSSILFDVVPVFLVFREDFLKMERLKISIDDQGYTRVDQIKGHFVLCALDWVNLKGFGQAVTEIFLRD